MAKSNFFASWFNMAKEAKNEEEFEANALAQVQNLQNENDRLKAENQTLQKASENVSSEVAQLRNEIAQLQGEKGKMQSSIDKLIKEVARLEELPAAESIANQITSSFESEKVDEQITAWDLRKMYKDGKLSATQLEKLGVAVPR